MITAVSADGVNHQFPDGTPPSVIDGAMKKYVAGKATPGWGETLETAVTNIPSSAAKLVGGIATAATHPLDTLGTAASATEGALHNVLPKAITDIADKINPEGEARAVKTADSIGDFYKQRYGSEEGFKKAVADDPVGVMADASVAFGGAASAAAKFPMLARAAALADKAATITNPIALAAKGVGAIAKGAGKVASETLGVTTGAGGDAIRTAYQAGKEGGNAGQAFTENLRGDAPAEGVVADAKLAVRNLRGERGSQYRSSMASIGADPTVLDFDGIDRAVANVSSVKNYKGIDISDSTAGVRDKIAARIDQWKSLDPKEYHTVEGMDALKQSIGDIRDSAPFNTPDRVVADNAYNAVRSEIVKQAPQYAKTMKAYEDASDEIRNVERTLSLNPRANVDTALRKLQSVMRDNVNTNYGNRGELASMLVDAGASHLMEKLAGQALKSPTSRGLGKMLMGGELGTAIVSVFMGHPGTAAAIAPALAAQSPRLAGEAAYYLGKAAKMSKGSARYAPSARSTAAGTVAGSQLGQLQQAGAQ